MTGFGAAEREGFKVEIRSLNHRYLDISVRMPSTLMEHEIPVRNIIKERFARGKFDITILFADERQMKVSINKELAKGMYNAFADLQKDLRLSGSLDIGFFSGYKDILASEYPEYNTDALYSAINDAVSKIEEMRKNEGEALRKDLLNHLVKIENIYIEIQGLSQNIVPKYREMLLTKIEELAPDLSLDETRLAQEVVFMAQKSDISEELARLSSHIKQFRSALSSGDAIGRKLDFILQEMNREANTIAAKIDDVRIITLTIDLKTEIEKIREQVQNIQ
jgi:uncharacterized protein (TIGR00255 family)